MDFIWVTNNLEMKNTGTSMCGELGRYFLFLFHISLAVFGLHLDYDGK